MRVERRVNICDAIEMILLVVRRNNGLLDKPCNKPFPSRDELAEACNTLEDFAVNQLGDD